MKAVERDRADVWKEFYLRDSNNDTNNMPLKYGDVIVLEGFEHRQMAADLNNGGTKFVYSNRTELINSNWGKFTVEPLSSKTQVRIGDDVLYGHPVTLKIPITGKHLAFRENQEDKLFWVAATEVKAWEQLTFVALP